MIELLQQHLPPGSFEAVPSADGMPTIYAPREQLVDTLRTLRDTQALGFRLLADICGVDYFPREPRFEVIYLLANVGDGGGTPKRLRLKVRVPGHEAKLPTVTHLFDAANWAERELWDFFGIVIEGHPDLRRLLMPEDWEGYPMRKDYPVQIKMPVKTYEPLQVSEEEFLKNIEDSRARSRRG
jgi:NADH-quinone oxidoreductase subunit C